MVAARHLALAGLLALVAGLAIGVDATGQAGAALGRQRGGSAEDWQAYEATVMLSTVLVFAALALLFAAAYLQQAALWPRWAGMLGATAVLAATACFSVAADHGGRAEQHLDAAEAYLESAREDYLAPEAGASLQRADDELAKATAESTAAGPWVIAGNLFFWPGAAAAGFAGWRYTVHYRARVVGREFARALAEQRTPESRPPQS